MAKARNIDEETLAIVTEYLGFNKDKEIDTVDNKEYLELTKMVATIRERMLSENSTELYGSQLYFEAVEALEKFEEEGVVRPGEVITFKSLFGRSVRFTKEEATEIKEKVENNIVPLDIKIALIKNLDEKGIYNYSEEQLDYALDKLCAYDKDDLILNIDISHSVVKESFEVGTIDKPIQKQSSIDQKVQQVEEWMKNNNENILGSYSKSVLKQYCENPYNNDFLLGKICGNMGIYSNADKFKNFVKSLQSDNNAPVNPVYCAPAASNTSAKDQATPKVQNIANSLDQYHDAAKILEGVDLTLNANVVERIKLTITKYLDASENDDDFIDKLYKLSEDFDLTKKIFETTKTYKNSTNANPVHQNTMEHSNGAMAEEYPDATKILGNANLTLKDNVVQRTKHMITEYLDNKIIDDNHFISKLYGLLSDDFNLVGDIFIVTKAHKNGTNANPVYQNTAELLTGAMSSLVLQNMLNNADAWNNLTAAAEATARGNGALNYSKYVPQGSLTKTIWAIDDIIKKDTCDLTKLAKVVCSPEFRDNSDRIIEVFGKFEHHKHKIPKMYQAACLHSSQHSNNKMEDILTKMKPYYDKFHSNDAKQAHSSPADPQISSNASKTQPSNMLNVKVETQDEEDAIENGFAEQGVSFVYDPGDFKTIDGNAGIQAAKNQSAMEVALKLNDIMTAQEDHYISDFNGMISKALEVQDPTIVIDACIQYCSLQALEQIVKAMEIYKNIISAKTGKPIQPLLDLVQNQIDLKNEDEYEDNDATFASLHIASFNNWHDDHVGLGGDADYID